MRYANALCGAACALALAACSQNPDETATTTTATPDSAATIPASLAPFGDGYPRPGDPCRTLGESDATRKWLDDSARLVGCPTPTDAQALGGRTVATVAGVTVLSIPMDQARAAMESDGPPPPPDGNGDAKVAGTDYDATTIMKCGFKGAAPAQDCNAGVKRNWGEPGNALVEVTRPDGTKRALFFEGTKPVGADSAQADGSAGWDFTVTRKGDEATIRFGPESYVVVDALIEGG